MNFQKIEAFLIDDWKKAFTFLSVWFYIIIGVLAIVPTYLPQFQGYVPEKYISIIAVLGIVARLVKQARTDKVPEQAIAQVTQDQQLVLPETEDNKTAAK